MSRKFYKFMLGAKSKEADRCRTEGFIGTDFDIDEDLTGRFPENWRDFNARWIPVLQKPGISKIAAGLWAGQLWTMGYWMSQGDIVLCPTGKSGELVAGEITSEYYYAADGPLPHRRKVRWLPGSIQKDSLSDALRSSLGSGSTLFTLESHAAEISAILSLDDHGPTEPIGIAGEGGATTGVFAMEKYLEEFLVSNWARTDFGRTHDIFTIDGEIVGQQFQTDNGRMDILAISKNKREILIIELKRGKASDAVVGQVQRYMGYAIENLVEEGQTVRGAIVALEDDLSIRRALLVATNVEFYRYKVDFKLERV
ncbi:MAG: endonuclease NucS domain-containing protein [Actinomycetota bacterium]